MRMSRHELELFADYHQFYLRDEAAKGDLSDAWTPQAMAANVALAPSTVGVGTARNTDVPVVVEVLPTAPPLDLTLWDHVVECDLAVTSGKLVIAGCTDYFPTAHSISASKGNYRVRVLFAGLGTLSSDGLDGGDRYELQLWPSPAAGLQILKQDATPNGRVV
jgi:hypothetical protein